MNRNLLAASIVAACLCVSSVAPVRAQSESVAPGTGDVSGPASRPMAGASMQVLGTLNLNSVLSTPRSTHVARFDESRGDAPDRRTPRERAQLGRYLISTRRASTRFVPQANSTPRSAVYLAEQASPSLGRANVSARLGESLASFRQLAFYARLSADDIADAMTLAALMSYRDATGRQLRLFSDDANSPIRDEALVRAVRDQMRNIVRRDADLQGMDAPQKRFVAEMFQMLATLSTLPQGRTKQEQAKRRRDARLVFQFVTGRSASAAKLSGNGFAPTPQLAR